MSGRILSRWGIATMLAAGLGMSVFVAAPARANGNDWVRVAVDIADVIYHSGQPYYRHGHGYGPRDRLVVVYDRYHRPVYYREVERVVYRPAPRARGYVPVYYPVHHAAPRYDAYRYNARHDHRYRDSRRDHRRDDRYDARYDRRRDGRGR